MARERESAKANKQKNEEMKMPVDQTAAPDSQGVLNKVEGNIKVIHGANDGTFQVAGSKVSAVRAALVEAFNIPGGALAFVDGEEVNDEYVLQEGQQLEFVKSAGVKG